MNRIPPPKPIQPDTRRVYLDELEVGSKITIFDRAYPEGRDAMVWGEPHTNHCPGVPGLSDPWTYDSLPLLVWNEDHTDYHLHDVPISARNNGGYGWRSHHRSMTSVQALGLYRGNGDGRPHEDHYTVAR